MHIEMMNGTLRFTTDKVKSADINDIVIIGDSFIASEICGWLTTGLEEKKKISVVMQSKAPMTRTYQRPLKD
jgi:hypothetical protein